MLKEQQTSSSLFLFPNPYPLLRSFDIPAPIIYPPGIDVPDSFFNPNPHADDGLAPMAVDSCAAGIITNLTASEHAGGGLIRNEEGKAVNLERCKRKANGLLASDQDDADMKRGRR